MQNFYEILGIESNASSMEIERAIRSLRQRGEVEDKVLDQARTCLIDPKMRTMYNKKMGIKVAARPRGGSGLSSSTPFWIPVGIIVAILVIAVTGMHFARKDAAEKGQEAKERAQMAKVQEQEREENGGVAHSKAVAKSQAWTSGNLLFAAEPQYIQKTTQLQSEFSVFKEASLVLSVPEGEQSHLLILLDQPITCQNDCRIQLEFDAYNRFALPAQAHDQHLMAPITDSVLNSFANSTEVTVVLPDQDQSTFLFTYPALSY